MFRRVCMFTGIAVLMTLAAPAAHPGHFPLLIDRLDIGDARSLPWGSGGDPLRGAGDYDRARLIADTEALLGFDVPVIVRMETLRRAVVYARGNPALGTALLERLGSRAADSRRERRPHALIFFDVGYAHALIDEADRMDGTRMSERNLSQSFLELALEMRPDDPALHFAAARVGDSQRGRLPQEYVKKARDTASRDPLVARNLRLLN